MSTYGSKTSHPATICESGSRTILAKWPEFKTRYRAELKQNPEAVAKLKAAAKGNATLLFGAKDGEHNNAVVLRDFLSA